MDFRNPAPPFNDQREFNSSSKRVVHHCSLRPEPMSVKQINQKSPSLGNKLELVVYMRCWPGGAMPPRTPGAILQIAHPQAPQPILLVGGKLARQTKHNALAL